MFFKGTRKSIVLCISSLTSLMMDQGNKYTPKGIASEFVSGQQADSNITRKILNGAVHMVFITPESILENPLYRNMLLSQPYRDKLVALVVDEAHCVKLWRVFGEIGDLRSLISGNVQVMAQTATATEETLSIVTKKLSMRKPTLIALSPFRVNIACKVHPKINIQEFADSLCSELLEKRTLFPKTVVYVRKLVSGGLYSHMEPEHYQRIQAL